MMAAKRRLWIWDLDDTLMWTSWAYSRAFRDFYEFMLELCDKRLVELRTLGTISEQIDKALIEQIDPQTNEPFGYSMRRFPTSLVKTYQELCERRYCKYHELVARRVFDIGMTAFDPLGYKLQGLVEGAVETLDYVRGLGDVQILVTKGERLVQEYKIEALGLHRWFGDELHIVADKNTDTFERYAGDFPDLVPVSVGNSFNSDIGPAVRAGVSAIYLPYYTWLAEPIPDDIDMTKILIGERVTDVIEFCQKGVI